MGIWNWIGEPSVCRSLAQPVQGHKRVINLFQLIYHFVITMQN